MRIVIGPLVRSISSILADRAHVGRISPAQLSCGVETETDVSGPGALTDEVRAGLQPLSNVATFATKERRI